MWKMLRNYFMPQYVSELDQFMQHFDQTHPQTEEQKKEVERCRKIFDQRDHENAE